MTNVETDSESAPDPKVERRAIGDPVAPVAAPRGADRRRERKRVARSELERELGAHRRLKIAEIERSVPCVTGVHEGGRVHRVEKERPGPQAALRSRDRPPVIGVEQRDVTPGERVGRKATKQRHGPAIEAGDAGIRR